jgi:hypothetical protein
MHRGNACRAGIGKNNILILPEFGHRLLYMLRSLKFLLGHRLHNVRAPMIDAQTGLGTEKSQRCGRPKSAGTPSRHPHERRPPGCCGHLAAEPLCDENCTPNPVLSLGTNSCPARSPPRSGCRGRPPRRTNAGEDDAQATPHIVGLLQSHAAPPSRHGRRDAMTATQRTRTTVNISGFFACEEGGEHHLQSAVRPRAPRPGRGRRCCASPESTALATENVVAGQGSAARTCTGRGGGGEEVDISQGRRRRTCGLPAAPNPASSLIFFF